MITFYTYPEHSPKWDERHFKDGTTYGEMTLQKALSATSAVYRPATDNITAEYSYVNEHGELLYQKIHYGENGIVQRRPYGSRWIYGLGEGLYQRAKNNNWYRVKPGRTGETKRFPEVQRVLYRLPDVKAAINAGGDIWIVRGEYLADRLAERGIAATMAPDNRWRADYTSQLRGARRVFVATDINIADIILRALNGRVGTVLMREMPGDGRIDINEHRKALGS